MKHTLTLIAAAALIAATPKPSPSASPASPAKGAQYTVGVWTVNMSTVDADFKTGDFSTPKTVTMTRQGGDVSGDRANGNYKTKIFTLYGHVVMHDSQGNFSGLAGTSGSSSHGPATLTSDQVNIDGTAKVYTATGNVHYVQADTTVDAAKGVLNDATHVLNLDGNVRIVQGDRTMKAEHVVYNTVTGKAHGEGDVVMQFPSEVNPHFATPKPITIKNPLQRHTAQPSAQPSTKP